MRFTACKDRGSRRIEISFVCLRADGAYMKRQCSRDYVQGGKKRK